jgi:hypothetical protein
MKTKFILIGLVSVLAVGAGLHHARICPLQSLKKAMTYHAAPAPAIAKVAKDAKDAKDAKTSLTLNR